ncbi:MAG: IS1595 family transposase [Acidobacteriota bacterium]|nr:IS1595 family transposase [Acidobacteriota bacterium]
MVSLRWPDGKVLCPQCGASKVTYLAKARVWKCYGGHSQAKFSLKTGTIFEDSPLPLSKWLPAVWLIVGCKNGISSYEIGRDLGISQKSSWHMMHRIRYALQSGSIEKFSGHVEVDETFIGGASRNMHKAKRARVIKGSLRSAGKTIVMGILERGGKVHTAIVPNVRRKPLHDEIKKHVEPGSDIYSDKLHSYKTLEDANYKHHVIDHLVSYVEGNVHTNGLENFWSLLKRGLDGTYISVEPFHLFRYLDEQMFRYNNRKGMDDFDRFKLAMSQIVGKRLTWNRLTGNLADEQTWFN